MKKLPPPRNFSLDDMGNSPYIEFIAKGQRAPLNQEKRI